VVILFQIPVINMAECKMKLTSAIK